MARVELWLYKGSKGRVKSDAYMIVGALEWLIDGGLVHRDR